MRDSLEFPSSTVTLCYIVRTALLCCSCKLFINSSLADSQSVYVQSIYTVFQTRSSAVAVIAGRTACSILTLFIVSTTSRPLNKKSVCCQTANPINKFAVRTPLHVHCSRQSRHTPPSESAVAPNGTVPTRSPRKKHCNCVPVFGLRLRFVFCGAFCG